MLDNRMLQRGGQVVDVTFGSGLSPGRKCQVWNALLLSVVNLVFVHAGAASSSYPAEAEDACETALLGSDCLVRAEVKIHR
jgi:hypothetical protein